MSTWQLDSNNQLNWIVFQWPHFGPDKNNTGFLHICLQLVSYLFTDMALCTIKHTCKLLVSILSTCRALDTLFTYLQVF